MKKIALLFIFAFLFWGCWEDLSGPSGKWCIKNTTNQTLKLSDYPYDFLPVTVKDVSPGDSIIIADVEFEGSPKKPYFSYWLEIISRHGGEAASLKVFSESGILLEEWNYADRNLSGKQFFKESSWRYYPNIEEQYQNGGYIGATWVFEILPEDLEEESDE